MFEEDRKLSEFVRVLNCIQFCETAPATLSITPLGGFYKAAAESGEDARHRIALNPTGASKRGSAILCSLPVCPIFPMSEASATALPAVYAHEAEVGGMEALSFDAD
jgi:hypothetical protein